MSEFYVTHRDIIGSIAANSIHDDGSLPFEYEKTLEVISHRIKCAIELLPEGQKTLNLIEFKDADDFHEFIKGVVLPIPQFRKWNLTDEEYAAGVDPDDPERKVKFQAKGFSEKPGRSFLDLDGVLLEVRLDMKYKHERTVGEMKNMGVGGVNQS